MSSLSPIYINPHALTHTHPTPPSTTHIQAFHAALPNFAPTPLIPLPSLATALSLGKLYVKDESNRLNLPAFKILGASWGCFRAVSKLASLPLNSAIEKVGEAARERGVVFYAATDGNHGRAVARMAGILGVKAVIVVPEFTDRVTRERIEGEGAEVRRVKGDYDEAVAEAARLCEETGKEGREGVGVLVQDNAWEGYEEVPAWIVDGYSTMLVEVEEQLETEGVRADIIVTPIGVGSLGTAVVRFAKCNGRGVKVIAVEPEAAACLNENLRKGRHAVVETGKTIMDGMCCGTVSTTAWSVLRDGVDASVTVGEKECHDAVQFLHSNDINAGPCGAAAIAGLRRVVNERRDELGLRQESVVVLLSTEGARPYESPT